MRTIFDRRGREGKENKAWLESSTRGFFTIALGCKSYKCAERKQTLKHQKEAD